MTGAVSFRWLGAAGVELECEGYILAVDPFFTRPPFRRLWIGRVSPDRALAARRLPRCDAVLITHAHYDHLMDAPAVIDQTGATVHGSPNAVRLLHAAGVPPGRVRLVAPGDRLQAGPFEVEVTAASHPRTPIDAIINRPLPGCLRPPLRLTDYRMDACYGFRVDAGGNRCLFGNPEPADVWFGGLFNPAAWPGGTDRPRLIVPIHWDDLFRPLAAPIRPVFRPPAAALPPLRRFDPAWFKRRVEQASPGTQVVIPDVFRRYTLRELAAAVTADWG